MVFWPPTHGISTPLPMVYRPPYPWYIDLLNHGISTPLPMVYWPPYPWYIDPLTHGISTPLTMVYQTLSYGIMNSSLLVEMRGGSIYHEGVQNTMTKNWPQGQNTIWKIEPGVKISWHRYIILSFATEHLIKLPVHFIQFLLKMRKFLKKLYF